MRITSDLPPYCIEEDDGHRISTVSFKRIINLEVEYDEKTANEEEVKKAIDNIMSLKISLF